MSGGAPTTVAIKRLQKELKEMRAHPPPHVDAAPDEANILLWHYIIEGPKGTPYEGGVYAGRMRFPPEYPYGPPSIQMTTPNGRFVSDTRLCFSMSDFHPKEWNPLWGVATIVSGLLSFMLESSSTHGSMDSTVEYKREMAVLSHQANLNLPHFRQLFPQWHAFCAKQVDRINRLATGEEPVPQEAWPLSPRAASMPVEQRPILTDAMINEMLLTHPELRIGAVPKIAAAGKGGKGAAGSSSSAKVVSSEAESPTASPSRGEGTQAALASTVAAVTSPAVGRTGGGAKARPSNNSWVERVVRVLQVVIVGCMAVLVAHVVMS